MWRVGRGIDTILARGVIDLARCCGVCGCDGRGGHGWHWFWVASAEEVVVRSLHAACALGKTRAL